MLNFLSDGSTGFQENIGNTIDKYLTSGYEFLINLDWWLKAIIILAVAIILVIGIFRLIAKTWKFVLVLAIIGGVGFAIYYFVIKDNNTAQAITNCLNNIAFLL